MHEKYIFLDKPMITLQPTISLTTSVNRSVTLVLHANFST